MARNRQLSNRQVARIRERFDRGTGLARIGADYDLSIRSVSDIVRGVTYPDAPGPTVEGYLSPAGRRKLEDGEARLLLEEYEVDEAVGTRTLADRFGLARSAVQRLVQRRTYKDVAE